MKRQQIQLFQEHGPAARTSREEFLELLSQFSWQGRTTSLSQLEWGGAHTVPVFTNEFWTSQQRAAHSLHEISYRACFKPQLPAFFIERFSSPGDLVFDPFAGRGTTLLEAALRGRAAAGAYVNPLSRALVWPRLAPPAQEEVRQRVHRLELDHADDVPEELLTFYHPATLRAICAVRNYLLARRADGTIDTVDEWIEMVTLNRLTGHSVGFLSVYTLPPNQATSVRAQQKINIKRNQTPPLRDFRGTILRKSAALMADLDDESRARLRRIRERSLFHVGSCLDEFGQTESVQLLVTSPPFLNVVDYASDNWLRCWFLGIAAGRVAIAMHSSIEGWQQFVAAAFRQFYRLLRPNGVIAFEVGEVRHGSVRLEEAVLPCGVAAGFVPLAVVVNAQVFTKTANIWGVKNNAKGTNTNRIVVFHKPG